MQPAPRLLQSSQISGELLPSGSPQKLLLTSLGTFSLPSTRSSTVSVPQPDMVRTATHTHTHLRLSFSSTVVLHPPLLFLPVRLICCCSRRLTATQWRETKGRCIYDAVITGSIDVIAFLWPSSCQAGNRYRTEAAVYGG